MLRSILGIPAESITRNPYHEPSHVAKTSKKRDVELTEKELAQASGGGLQWGIGRGIKQ